MTRLSKDEIGARAKAIAEKIRRPELSISVMDGESVIGGGAAPSAALPTTLLALTSKSLTADELAARLRASSPPIIARVEDARVLLDLRTVFPEQDETMAVALQQI
jgi:L-seryl-tRNA(Ser) seleniumtransferase